MALEGHIEDGYAYSLTWILNVSKFID